MGCGSSSTVETTPVAVSTQNDPNASAPTQHFVQQQSRDHEFKEGCTLAADAASLVPVVGQPIAAALLAIGTVYEVLRDASNRESWVKEFQTEIETMGFQLQAAIQAESITATEENAPYFEKLETVLKECVKLIVEMNTRGALTAALLASHDKEALQVALDKMRSLRGDAAFSMTLGLTKQLSENTDAIERNAEELKVLAAATKTPQEILEAKLLTYRHAATESTFMIDSSSLHIPSYGHTGRKFVEGSSELFNMLERSLLVLNDPSKSTLVVLGDSGSGKSVFLRQLWRDANIKAEETTTTLAAFVDMSTNKDAVPLEGALQREAGLNAAEILMLKEKEDLHLQVFFDAYDEIGEQVTLRTVNLFSEWKGSIHIVVTCRTQYAVSLPDNVFIVSMANGTATPVEKVYMSGLTKENRNSYIEKYVAYSRKQKKEKTDQVIWTKEEYIERIQSLPGIDNFVDVIFRLRVILDILPHIYTLKEESKVPSTQVKGSFGHDRNFLGHMNVYASIYEEQQLMNRPLEACELYDTFVTLNFERQMTEKQIALSLHLRRADYQAYCEELSVLLHRDNDSSTIVFDEDDADDRDSVWFPLLSTGDPRISALRAAAPLKSEEDRTKFQFNHKSLQDFFLSCAIVRTLRSFYTKNDKYDRHAKCIPGLTFMSLQLWNIKNKTAENDGGTTKFTDCKASQDSLEMLRNSPLNSNLQAEIIVFLSQHARCQMDWLMNALFLTVFASRDATGLEWASSNAMTVLNLSSQTSFSGMDLSNLQLPYAKLPHAVLSGTNFTNTNLSHADLTQAHLDFADFRGCDMSHLTLGMLPQMIDHEGSARAVAFAPDGKTLASGGDDNIIRTWNLETGDVLQRFECKAEVIATLVYTPDGKRLIAGARCGRLLVWDVEAGLCNVNIMLHRDRINSVAVNADATMIATGCDDGSAAVWNAQSMEKLHEFDGHVVCVNQVSFAPDGTALAIAGNGGINRRLCSYSLLTNEIVQMYNGQLGEVCGVKYSKSGKYVVSCSVDKHVRVRDASTGELIHELKGHALGVRCVDISHDDTLLVSGSFDNTLRLWNVEDGSCISEFSGHTDAVVSVAFAADGRSCASASKDGTVRIWDTSQTNDSWRQDTHLQPQAGLNSLAFSSDGHWLVTGCYDRYLRLYDVSTGTLVWRIRAHAAGIRSVGFSSDGKHILSAGDDEFIRIWNVQTAEHVSTLSGHLQDIQCANWSPDNTMIVSSSDDATVKLWDVAAAECVDTYEDQDAGDVTSVEFTADGKAVVSGRVDGSICVYDVSEKKVLREINAHSDCVRSIACGKVHSHLIASCSDDESVRLWDLNDPLAAKRVFSPDDDAGYALSVAYSSNDEQLVSTTENGRVLVWTAASQDLTYDIAGHSSAVKCAAFHPQRNNIIASCGMDKSMRLTMLRPDKKACLLWWTASAGLTAHGARLDKATSCKITKRNYTVLMQCKAVAGDD